MRVASARVVGLIGYPLKHSISPAFQQAAFDYHALPVRYEAWETPPQAVAAAVDRARRSDCLGMNVTIPHKEVVLAHLDSVDERAAQIGAVNTVVNRDGHLTGYNTDADGFLRGLRERGHYEPTGKRGVLLGAGGVARAVALALVWAEAASLIIFNRTPGRAEALALAVRDLAPGFRVEALPCEDHLLRRELAEADLLVNTTPIGMRHGPSGTPLPAAFISADLMVYDLVYNPPQTQLLLDAARVGARTLNGLPMLVYQGAAAFELWTGRRAPIGLMMKRADEALRA